MTITVGGTNITFNDATTQTTAPVNTNANVNSITAGTGISVNSSTGAVTITNTNTATGTVTSVATGNGLSGGTITSTGTLVVACPTFNTVGSYVMGTIQDSNNAGIVSGNNYSPGTGTLQVQSGGASSNQCGWSTNLQSNNLSGSWKWMGATYHQNPNYYYGGVFCRVS
jgi:hypothetical protein